MTGDLAFDGRNHDLGTISVSPVSPARDRLAGGAIVAVTPGNRRDPTFAAVPADEVPDVARRIVQQMHEAAGLTPPVVLDRPHTEYAPDGYVTPAGKVVPFYGDAGTVVMYPPGLGGVSPVVARELASALAACADDIDSRPLLRKRDVDALAQLIRSGWLDGPREDAYGFVAAAILRAGYRPPENGSEAT
jgi:hypothetical protein